MKSTTLFGIVCGLSLASAIGDGHKLGSEGSAIGQVAIGLKTETETETETETKTKTKKGQGSKVVRESWTINVEGGEGCSCTDSSFNSRSSLGSECLYKLKNLCKVTVTEGIVPLGAANICPDENKTLALAPLEDFYDMPQIEIHRVEPGLAYSSNSSCVGTDRKVAYLNQGGFIWPCSTRGDLYVEIPSTWSVDSSGRITTLSQEPFITIDNMHGGDIPPPVVHFTAGTGPGCALSENTTDSQIHFSGVISDLALGGSYYTANLNRDDWLGSRDCPLPESCLAKNSDRQLFIEQCLSLIPNRCSVIIQGKQRIENNQIEICDGLESIAYISIPEDFRNLTTSYNVELVSTGLKFASETVVSCSENPATRLIAARVDKSVWDRHLCEQRPINEPALEGNFKSGPGVNTNINFHIGNPLWEDFGPDDYALAISAGKAAAGCNFNQSDYPIFIQFKGRANPELLSSSALSYLSASSFFALLVVCFYV